MESDVAMRDKIKALFEEVWRDDKDCEPPTIADDTVLLETGLDSMGFALLVTRLDDELGFDPFSMDDEAVYPRTFGDFVKVYATALPRK